MVTRFATPEAKEADLWIVRLNGEAKKVDLDMRFSDNGGLVQLDPAGRRIAFVATAGETGAEVWALENFLLARNGRAAVVTS